MNAEEVIQSEAFIKWFADLSNKDVAIAGGKGASLAEMYNHGFPIPPGFMITAQAYQYFIEKTGLANQIHAQLHKLNIEDTARLNEASQKIRTLIDNALMPRELEMAIIEAYDILDVERGAMRHAKPGALDILRLGHEPPFVAVRSSATTEDLADASFAGQQDSFLAVKGKVQLIQKVKCCFSSLFTARAIYYRQKKGFVHENARLAVVIQKMINSQKSGVIFSKNPLKNDNTVVIEAVWGLGEGIVSGRILPDHYQVGPDTEVQEIKVADKKVAMVRTSSGAVEGVKLTPERSSQQVLSGYEIKRLAQYALQLEEHYGKPQDIEFAIDREIYIVQSRPITTKAREDTREITGNVLLFGMAASPGVGSGKVRIVQDLNELDKVQQGDILVTEMTNPDMVVSMQRAAGIVTNEGGLTCFAEDTTVLTNNGFMTIRDATEMVHSGQELALLAYDTKHMKPAWKRVISAGSRKREVIRVSVSQKGIMEDNTLDLTPDHKMFTFNNREIIKKEISSILENQEHLCILDSLPQSLRISQDKLAYLMGALVTDGCVSINMHHTGNPRRGIITFTQKENSLKQGFINTVRSYFEECFGDRLKDGRVKHTIGNLSGRIIQGYASDFICSNLDVSLTITNLFKKLDIFALNLDYNSSLNFLAGLIDGDGCYHQNRLHIYASEEITLQGIILACLNIGIFPQVTRNRSIYHIQILEKIPDILRYTQRVKGETQEKILGNKLFAAKQIFGDIVDDVNYLGHLKPYVNNNLLIDSRKIEKFVLPLAKGEIRDKLLSVLGSGLRMQRVKKISDIGQIEVYNLEIEADTELDHNYIVFTKKYTPLLVSNSHAAIVSREMGIPCIVATRNATTTLKEGQIVTVDGFSGRVIEGYAEEKKVEINPIVKTRTKIKVIVDLPDYAPRAALSGAKSVGLVRLEGIIAIGGKHPAWYIKNNKLRDYIASLSSGLKKIAVPFEEIWVRTSDIRSDEYRHLDGAPQIVESNPMLGNHGARFSVRNIDLLAAEFQAIKEVADEFPHKIIGVMMPQVISVEEVNAAKQVAQDVHMPSNTKIGIMIETPAAVQIINELCEAGIAFVSFGTNDLTQFTLAIDRNNPSIQELYDEMHPAVLHSLSYVIRRCKKYGVETSICGQAGSRPEMARFLVREGIDSISCNADAARLVSENVAAVEASHGASSESPSALRRPANEHLNTREQTSSQHDVPRASMNTTENTTEVRTSEEELILKALENTTEEYNPGSETISDVPSLNDAIPVDSEHFNSLKEDKIVDVF